MNATTAETKIKFQKHHLVVDGKKHPVSYWADDTRKVVTIYDREYGSALFHVFPDLYRNESDSQTDYFEHGRVVIPEGHEYYAPAKERCDANAYIWKAKRAVSDKVTIKAFYKFHKRRPRGRGTWVLQAATAWDPTSAHLTGEPMVFNGSLEEAKRAAVKQFPEAKYVAILP